MQRPTAVTVFGILNIVFAALGACGLLATVAMFVPGPFSDQNPVVKIMEDHPAYALWVKVTIPLGLAAVVVLLAAGIGLLQLKEWGRKLSIGYAIYAILSVLANAAISFIVVVPALMEAAAQRHGPEAAGAAGGVIGAVFGVIVGPIYPCFLLYFMTRPYVKAAFLAPSAAEFWEDDRSVDRW
jgi:hypothetical protein